MLTVLKATVKYSAVIYILTVKSSHTMFLVVNWYQYTFSVSHSACSVVKFKALALPQLTDL